MEEKDELSIEEQIEKLRKSFQKHGCVSPSAILMNGKVKAYVREKIEEDDDSWKQIFGNSVTEKNLEYIRKIATGEIEVEDLSGNEVKELVNHESQA